MVRQRSVALATLASIVLLAGCRDKDPTAPTPAAFAGCANVTALTIGTTVNGALTNSSCVFVGDATNFYEFQLTQQRTVTIAMNSTQFDTYLILFDRASGNVITFDDDSGSGFNAMIVQPLAAGTYIIGATSFDGSLGSYTLVTSQ